MTPSVLVNNDPLARVVATATLSTPKPGDIDRLDSKIKRIEAKTNALLSLEEETKKAVKLRMAALLAERAIADVKLPRIDLEVLKWRDHRGFPTLALLHVNNGLFQVRSNGYISLPEELAAYYQDVPATINRHCATFAGRLPTWALRLRLNFKGILLLLATTVFTAILGSTLLVPVATAATLWIATSIFWHLKTTANTDTTIATKFSGALPDNIREQIKMQDRNFHDLFILAEVKDWQLKRVVRPWIDPLLLGYKNGSLFLIDKFQTTPTEEFVAQEFASSD